MVSKFALLIDLLVTSVALAVPSSRLEPQLARLRKIRRFGPTNRAESPVNSISDVVNNTNWAGAVLGGGNGTLTNVTGTFTVPTPSGSSGAASIWVGFDGYTCHNALFQTGVDFFVTDVNVTYEAWYEWYPDYARVFTGVILSAGDIIKATVTVNSTTSGTAIIENLTTGQTIIQNVNSSSALCRDDAEWIVEDFINNSGQVPFANFGNVTFGNATASRDDGTTYTPSNATLVEIVQNDQVLTSISASGDTVTISYV